MTMNNLSKVLRGEKSQHRIIYLPKISFENWVKIKSFSNKQKMRKFINKSALYDTRSFFRQKENDTKERLNLHISMKSTQMVNM